MWLPLNPPLEAERPNTVSTSGPLLPAAPPVRAISEASADG
jgi:hypothetical protein